MKTVRLAYYSEGRAIGGRVWHIFHSSYSKSYRGGLRHLKRLRREYKHTDWKFRLVTDQKIIFSV